MPKTDVEAVQWPLQFSPTEERFARGDDGDKPRPQSDERPLTRDISIRPIRKKRRKTSLVVGSTRLYQDGQTRLIPMPSSDPRDPLNLPKWRKWTAVGIICFFGAVALAADVVIGSLIPIFLLEYANLDPRSINRVNFSNSTSGRAVAVNPMAVIPQGVTPPSLSRVTMLATIPLLSNGGANYLLVPLSIAIGRRPVLLLASACAWGGSLAAGLSRSLTAHLIARIIQGFGAGAVEALVPLIVTDVMFVHERNAAMSAISWSQGVAIAGLGAAAPYIAANFTWRILYFITAGLGFVAWVLLIGLLPETRFPRSRAELSGTPLSPLSPGRDRPELDYDTFGRPSISTTVGFFQFGFQWRNALKSILDTLRTTLFPAVLFSILANTIFIVVAQAVQQLSTFTLLAQGWQFQHTGLAVVPFIAAAVLVFIAAGPAADKLTLLITSLLGGHREAEHQLPNLIVPFLAGIGGVFLFGVAGQENLHWALVLVGAFLIIFGFLATASVANVFIVESYPMWAGPVLVNVGSLRLIVAFFLANQTTSWVVSQGFLRTFVFFAEALIITSLGIPALWFGGRKVRLWTAGKVDGTGARETVEPLEEQLGEKGGLG